MFSIIAAIGKNRALGKDNDLIFHIKEDMKFFRTTTKGHKVVMGRKTWESLPGKLKDRENIVISKEPVTEADQTVSNLEAYVKDNIDSSEEIFVIGGGSVYEQFLPYAKNLYLTEIKDSPEADIYFPRFDKKHYHRKTLQTGEQDGLSYKIIKYSK